MSPLKRLAILISGSRLVQRRLAKRVRFAQHLMGIGSGDQPESSGERRLFEAVCRRSSGPWIVMDVGANHGQFMKMALREMPTAATQIHCFEPGARAFEELRRNADGDPRVRLNRVALGSAPGTATLHYEEQGSGLASLTRRDLEHFGIHFGLSEPVEVTTVDAYCDLNGIDRIHLLKLDVEGHELEVLHGARRMLGAGGVDALTFEFGGCNIDTRTFFRDFWKLLGAHGMTIHRITPSGFWSVIDRYEEAHEQFRTTNFVALRSH